MEIPRVNPVGLVEQPPGFETTPRQHPLWLRALVLLLLLVFGGVTVVTTVVSLGRYCLTTDTSDVRDLPQPYRPAPEGE
ncbi:MAG: hypothetical protein KDD47_07785 [Acidobacteria bacterium]|nr:hypothetical protein [Acidobacteriota bacterium]